MANNFKYATTNYYNQYLIHLLMYIKLDVVQVVYHVQHVLYVLNKLRFNTLIKNENKLVPLLQ